jgi:hypothetical protein
MNILYYILTEVIYIKVLYNMSTVQSKVNLYERPRTRSHKSKRDHISVFTNSDTKKIRTDGIRTDGIRTDSIRTDSILALDGNLTGGNLADGNLTGGNLTGGNLTGGIQTDSIQTDSIQTDSTLTTTSPVKSTRYRSLSINVADFPIDINKLCSEGRTILLMETSTSDFLRGITDEMKLVYTKISGDMYINRISPSLLALMYFGDIKKLPSEMKLLFNGELIDRDDIHLYTHSYNVIQSLRPFSKRM